MKACSMNMVRWNDALQRRLDHLFGRRGDHVKGELIPFRLLQQLRQQPDIRLEADLLSNFDQMLFADTTILRVVQQQVGKLSALLNKMHARQTIDFPSEIRSADQLAEDQSRIVEAEGLIKVAGQ